MTVSVDTEMRLRSVLTRKGAADEIINILNQAGSEGRAVVNTAITTIGAGTLSAAGIAGGVITRSGSVAAYTDTTATALGIVAAVPGAFATQTFFLHIKNTVGFSETLAAGSGVTLSGQTIIPPYSDGLFLVTLTSLTAVAILGINSTPLTTPPKEVATALTTVGAGTITAAGIAGSVTTRGGAQSGAAFTDTTDTATNIIAARPNIAIGQSWEYLYRNNTDAVATLTGGTGVTVSVNTGVRPNTWSRYLVTYTAAATITMVGIEEGQAVALRNAQFVTGTTTTTFAAGQLTGAGDTVYTNTQATPGSIATRTATEMFGDIPDAQAGMTYNLRVTNNQGTGTLTITAGTGVTLTGTMTIPPFSWRDFVVTLNSATTATIQDVGSGSMSLSAAGVAAGYKIARGIHQQVAASDTIVSGLTTVVSVVATYRDTPTAKQNYVTTSIGDQAGTPAAGSFLMRTFKSTFAAADDFTDNISLYWEAIGT